MRDKLLRALGPTGRTRGAANARSKIIIMHNSSCLGSIKCKGRFSFRSLSEVMQNQFIIQRIGNQVSNSIPLPVCYVICFVS